MIKEARDYDAIVIGAGPNGLSAAITLQRSGKKVLLVEGKDQIGGGLRTAELTLPGYHHDVCSAIHPLAAASPFFKSLSLELYGLKFIQPEIACAHPLDNGEAVILLTLKETATGLGVDAGTYRQVFEPLNKIWRQHTARVLGPLQPFSNPAAMLRFGSNALLSAKRFAEKFNTKEARALLAGLAAHGIQALDQPATAAAALVLALEADRSGWPVIRGGSQKLADALEACFRAPGGEIETGFFVKELKQLPSAKAILFDITPQQLLQIAGYSLSAVYKWQLRHYKQGAGIFKIDWALAEQVPFVNENCRKTATVHIGGTFEEIAVAEKAVQKGHHPDKPFVLFAQQSIFDKTRAPENRHTGWAYCHVPAGSKKDMTEAIEQQMERFAPGFRERILARHTLNTQQLEAYNPNYIGGDINGGVQSLGQLFTRPALRWSPYRTSARGLYLCSSSTPPGGGVHGMCGFYAAKRALRDVFGEDISLPEN